MNKEQELYIEIKNLNEIINTPPNIFEEKMIEYSKNICNAGIDSSEIKSGIDYKMTAIKLCAEKLKNLI